MYTLMVDCVLVHVGFLEYLILHYFQIKNSIMLPVKHDDHLGLFLMCDKYNLNLKKKLAERYWY